MYCWLRSTLYARLTADGWNVGNDGAALYALRRYLIDRLDGDLAEASRHAREPIERALKSLRSADVLRVTPEDTRTGRRWRCSACGNYLPGLVPHKGYVEFLDCTGTAHAVPVAPCDIAWRGSGLTRQAMLVLVDNPSAPLERQLKDLPLFVPDVRVPLLARTTDERSKFDRGAMKWKQKGDRHRELERALAEGWIERCTKLVESFADIQAYYVR